MDAGNVSAIISAVAGISGVLLGNVFVLVKERFTTKAARQKETTYLGVIVVSHLERFANDCSHVAFDDGTEYGRPAGSNGECVPTTAPPKFQPLEINVDWRLLPKDLMYPILRLPDRQEQLHSKLEGITQYDYDPPEHTEYFWVRQRGYAEFGLQASDLASKLRTHAGIPTEASGEGEWDRDEHLKGVIADIDTKRAAWKRRQLEV
jgi:hypothetical protein